MDTFRMMVARTVTVGLVGLFLTAAAATPAAAQTTRAWRGADGAVWSTPANWDPVGAPVDGDSLLFDATSSIHSDNDLSDVAIDTITVDNDHWISGNAFRLTSGITKNANSFDITAIVTLDSDQTWMTTAGGAINPAEVALNGHAWTVDGTAAVQPMLVSGTGSIVKSGSGTLRFLANNTFAGPLTIDAGDVELFTAGALGVSDSTPENGTTVNAGGRLRVAPPAGALTLDAEALTLQGTGGVGTGALEVAALQPITFTGPITLAATTHVWGGVPGHDRNVIFNGPVKGPGDLVIVDGAAVHFANSGNTLTGVGFAGDNTGVARVATPGALNTARVNLPAGTTLDVTDTATELLGLDGAGSVTLGATSGQLTIKNTLPSAFTGTISGMGGLVIKDGPGTLTLGGANSFLFGPNVVAGTLRVTHPDALGLADGTALTGTFVSDGATLALDNVTITVPERIQIDGGAQVATLQVMGTNPSSVFGPLVLTRLAQITGTDGATLTVTMDLTAPAGFSLTNAKVMVPNLGIGGLVTVNAGGALIAGANGVFNSLARIALNGGALGVNGKTFTIGSLTGNGVVDFGTNGALTVATATDITFAGTGTGTGTFRKQGAGALTLTNAFAVTGNVTIQSGSLVIAHNQALLPTPLVTVGSGGMLKYMVAATVPYQVTYTGSGNSEEAGAVQVLGGDVTFSGPFVPNGFHESIRVNAPHVLTWAYPINTGTLQIMGSGTAVFGAAGNTLTLLRIGITRFSPIAAGPTTVKLGVAGAMNPHDIYVHEGSTFDLNGFDTTLKYLGGSGTVAIGARKLTVQSGSQFAGLLTGNGTIEATGDRLELDGGRTHTFNGSVTAVRFGNSGTFPASVHVTGTSMFLLPNSVTGPVSVGPGATLNPGGTPFVAGTATSGNVTVPAGARLAVEAHNAPMLKVNGTVTLGGELYPLLHPTVSTLNDTLVLIDNDGTDPIVGMFSNQSEGTTLRIAEQTYRISYFGGTGNDVTLTKNENRYYLSEGATGPFFDTDILIANPHPETAMVRVHFYRDDGEERVHIYNLAPSSRLTIHVDELEDMASTTFSTMVWSLDPALNLIVERTMRWDATGFGAHTEKATSGPALKWYFAEGSEGFFRTYLLLANTDFVPSTATVTYLREGGETPVVRTYELEAHSRRTIQAADDSELVGRSFGITVEYTRRGIAERAMYFGESPTWKGGHESMGETTPSPTWFLAEGATGAGFDTFILVANPNVNPVDVTYTFLSDAAGPATVTKTIPGQSRQTINIEAEGLSIPDGPVATQITATGPVIAERAQYWPLSFDSWTEAHNSFGVTEAGTKWGLAEGRAGGPESYQTYILLANAGTENARVKLEFLAEEGSTAPQTMTIDVPAQRRVNVPIDPTGADGDPATTFGTIITSDKLIVVERAMYWNVNGEVWAAGTNATATRLP